MSDFGWANSGHTGAGRAHYYRLQGPVLVSLCDNSFIGPNDQTPVKTETDKRCRECTRREPIING